MTREQAKQNLEVIKAFAEGKTIQLRKLYPINSKWLDIKAPLFEKDTRNVTFNTNECEYRIKPELKYVPFTFADRELLKNRWIAHKDSPKSENLIVLITEEVVYVNFCAVNYEVLCSDYFFVDSLLPVGKLQ